MQVDRLRLVGFKSFVDPTELLIEPGLTGIVGPNGCGKSNLVEALRWVMGEASARRLRGGEMDDVIFAGSATRPGRNTAEVSLTLDNAAREAPFAFNDRDAIEVRVDRQVDVQRRRVDRLEEDDRQEHGEDPGERPSRAREGVDHRAGGWPLREAATGACAV